MESDYAILIGLPSHIETAAFSFRRTLVADGGIPCPWPGGFLAGTCPAELTLKGKDLIPVWNEMARIGWRLGTGKPAIFKGIVGLSLEPDGFIPFFSRSGILSGLSVFCDRDEEPLPAGFLPVAAFDAPTSDSLLSGYTAAGETWSKLLVRKVRLSYPLGRNKALDAVVWRILEERTVLPADRTQR